MTALDQNSQTNTIQTSFCFVLLFFTPLFPSSCESFMYLLQCRCTLSSGCLPDLIFHTAILESTPQRLRYAGTDTSMTWLYQLGADFPEHILVNLAAPISKRMLASEAVKYTLQALIGILRGAELGESHVLLKSPSPAMPSIEPHYL